MVGQVHHESTLIEALDALAVYGTQVKAAAALKIPRSTLQSRVMEARSRGLKSGMKVEPPAPRQLPDAPTPETEAVIEKAAADLAESKAEVKRLEAALRKAQAQSADAAAVKAIIGETAERAANMTPPEWTIKEAKPSQPGVPTLFLSDLHWGEVVFPSQINGVNEYNLTIARRRLKDTVEAAITLAGIVSPGFDYPGIVLPLGGDMVSGDIHEELTATNEVGTIPVVLDMWEHLASAIGRVADVFGQVFLPCVTGNHGRNTRKIWNKDRHHTSFDWMLYQILAKHFANDKRVTFMIPDGSDAHYRIYGTRYLLSHGDQFRGGDGMIGPLGPITRGDHKKRSRNSQIDLDYDVMVIGHWHQHIQLSKLIVNGSLKGYDEYAYSNNFPFERPQQAMWITHPVHGPTFRMPVYAERQKRAPKMEWVGIRK